MEPGHGQVLPTAGRTERAAVSLRSAVSFNVEFVDRHHLPLISMIACGSEAVTSGSKR